MRVYTYTEKVMTEIWENGIFWKGLWNKYVLNYKGIQEEM